MMFRNDNRPKFAYDTYCSVCLKFKRLVSFFDAKNSVIFIPIIEAESMGLLNTISPNYRYESSHFIGRNGRVLSGVDGILELFSFLPFGIFLTHIIRSNRLTLEIVRFAYKALSRLHYAQCGKAKNCTKV